MTTDAEKVERVQRVLEEMDRDWLQTYERLRRRVREALSDSDDSGRTTAVQQGRLGAERTVPPAGERA